MAMMGQREYARHRGVTVRAVQVALEAKRITAEENGKIDSEKADRDWAENTGPRNIHLDDDPDAGQYNKARAARELYQFRLAKLEYEERTGKLISRDEVQVAAFNKYRRFRDQLLTIPDRVAAILAAETDAARVHEILAAELRRALNDSDSKH